VPLKNHEFGEITLKSVGAKTEWQLNHNLSPNLQQQKESKL